MPTDISVLINQAKCYECAFAPGLAQYGVLAALIDVADGVPVPTDPNQLLDQAKCLVCSVPPGLVQYLMVAAIQNM